MADPASSSSPIHRVVRAIRTAVGTAGTTLSRLVVKGLHLHKHARPEVEDSVGLVLSGGGSAAGFQVGALRYLYDTVGITPTVMAGTSAGSVLATLLAHGETHEEQRRILSEIDRVSQTMESASDLLTELAWFAQLQKLAPAWQRIAGMSGNRRPPWTIALPTVGLLRPRLRTTEEEPAEAIRRVVTVPHWNLSPVVDTLSTLWSVGRSGTDFGALLHGAQAERSMCVPGPVFDSLLDPQLFDPVRLAESSVALRIAVVSLESGDLRYVTGRGVLVDRQDRPLETRPVPMKDAVRASCAIPGVFPPVRLGDEHYVDGGTRENAPVDVAVSLLGAQRCYAILCLPQGLAPESDYADQHLLSIVLRSTAGIMADEVQRNDVERARAAGAIVIAPEINVHGVLTVDPGLLEIAKDYGYLRAAEACESATPDEQRITRELVETRRAIWSAENDLFGPRVDGSDQPATDLASLAPLKVRLRDLAESVPASRRPPGSDSWWSTWERHPFAIAAPVTWVPGESAA